MRYGHRTRSKPGSVGDQLVGAMRRGQRCWPGSASWPHGSLCPASRRVRLLANCVAVSFGIHCCVSGFIVDIFSSRGRVRQLRMEPSTIPHACWKGRITKALETKARNGSQEMAISRFVLLLYLSAAFRKMKSFVVHGLACEVAMPDLTAGLDGHMLHDGRWRRSALIGRISIRHLTSDRHFTFASSPDDRQAANDGYCDATVRLIFLRVVVCNTSWWKPPRCRPCVPVSRSKSGCCAASVVPGLSGSWNAVRSRYITNAASL